MTPLPPENRDPSPSQTTDSHSSRADDLNSNADIFSSSHQFTTSFDREFHARLGKFWALSPASTGGAFLD